MAANERLPVPDPSVLTTEQLHEALDRVKELTEALLSRQEDICNEKFASVDTQFQLIERQRVEQKTDTRTAVDAALAAAKEAVGKSEVSTKEQLSAMRAETGAAINAVSEALAGLKERVVAMESVKQGSKEALSGVQVLFATAIAAGGLVAAVYLASQP